MRAWRASTRSPAGAGLQPLRVGARPLSERRCGCPGSSKGAGQRVPPFVLNLSAEACKGLEREAKRQETQLDRLLEHAAMLYIADLDAGRVAKRIIRAHRPVTGSRPRLELFECAAQAACTAVTGATPSCAARSSSAARPRWCSPWIEASVFPNRSAISVGESPPMCRRTSTSRCDSGSSASASLRAWVCSNDVCSYRRR